MKNILKLIIGCLCISSLPAAMVTINNHSFENGAGLPPATGTVWNNNTPDGWVKAGTAGMQNVSLSTTTGPNDGDIIVFLQTGSLAQNITSSLLANAVGVGDVFTLTVAATNQNGSPTFEFDIRDNAVLANGSSLIGGPVSSSPNMAVAPNDYTDMVVGGTVDTAATEVWLFLSNNGGQVRVDNVRLDVAVAPVPEPSSTALLGLSGLALVLRRRR